jgi:hypothetical protein
MSKTPEQSQPELIRLRVNTIVDGVFYMAGTPTPFSETTLPEHLRPDIAVGDETFYSPSERNIYNNPQPGPDLGVVYQPLGGGQWVQRQARQALAISQEQTWCEEQAEIASKLSPETEEALQDSHSKHVALTKARMQYDRDVIDATYESAAQSAELPQRFVKRGSVFVRIEKAKLAAGENVFVRNPDGNHEIIGTTDVGAVPPEPPIIP